MNKILKKRMTLERLAQITTEALGILRDDLHAVKQDLHGVKQEFEESETRYA